MKENQLQIVTFDQAKKLKALGFDWEVNLYYNEQREMFIADNSLYRIPNYITEYEILDKCYSAPSVSLAFKWIRTEKGIPCHIEYDEPNLYRGAFYLGKFIYTPKYNYAMAEIVLLDDLLIILEKNSAKTKEQNQMFQNYGFYIDENSYYFLSTKKGEYVFRGSNFIIEPLYSIVSKGITNFLCKITNRTGWTKEVIFTCKDFYSVYDFKIKCESKGDFRFAAGEKHLEKIEDYLYKYSMVCKGITQLGWQKEGFWAWSNGIVKKGIFYPVNKNGIVEYDEENLCIQACSPFYKKNEMLFQDERKIKDTESSIMILDFTRKLEAVYGEKGIVGFSFYLATLFRDVIVHYFRFFPILNIYGPHGTGKTAMSNTLLKLFGDLSVRLNLQNIAIKTIEKYVSHTKNAIVHLDEYKNRLEYEKIEFLKGLWDGTGRSRINMDNDKETNPVDNSIILTGQEMPTLDIALFSRIIFLTVTKTAFSDSEKQNYNELKNIEKEGLTHITNQILKHRLYFELNYIKNYKFAMDDVSKLIDEKNIEDRILRNWIVILAAFRTLHSVIPIAFQYTDVLNIFSKSIIEQNNCLKD